MNMIITCRIIIFILMMVCNNTFGQNVMVNGISYEIKNDTATVIGCGQSEFEILIPPSITVDERKYIVAKISRKAFEGITNIVSIEMTSNIKEIGEYAFKGCSSLYSVTLPNGLVDMQTSLFENCQKLALVTIPRTVKTIGDNCFRGCHKISFINLPDYLRSIGRNAFAECTNLKSICIPDGVENIMEGCLAGCSSLEELTIPYVGTSLNPQRASEGTLFGKVFGKQAYNGCVETIQRSRLTSNSEGLVSFYIPKSLSKVTVTGNANMYYSFINCQNIKEIIIKGNVRIIGEKVFSECTGLKSITLPQSLCSIGVNSFHECSQLSQITIPQNMNKIDNSAFSGCNKLQKIELLSLAFLEGDKTTKMRDVFGRDINEYLIDVAIIPKSAFSGITMKVLSVGKHCRRIEDYSLFDMNVDTLQIHKNIEHIGNQRIVANHIIYNGSIEDWNIFTNGEAIGSGYTKNIYPDEFNFYRISSTIFEKKGLLYKIINTATNKISIIPQGVPYSKNIYIYKEISTLGKKYNVSSISNNTFDENTKIDSIFFEGSNIEWKKLDIGKNNEILKRIPITFNFNIKNIESTITDNYILKFRI